MKKLFTFCFFAFALLIGTQSAIAQNKLKINEKAANSAKELRAQLKFDEESLEKVYIAYQQYEAKMASLNIHTEKGAQYNKDKKEITMRLQQGIKNAISEDLYNRYLSLSGIDEIEVQEMNSEMQNKAAAPVKKSR